MSETIQTCPRCSNQCPQDDLKCPRGEAYFASQNGEGAGDAKAFEGHSHGEHGHGEHGGHHHGKGMRKHGHAFEGMDENSISYLICKTGHILGHIQAHGDLNEEQIFSCLTPEQQQELKTSLETVLNTLKAARKGAHHHHGADNQ